MNLVAVSQETFPAVPPQQDSVGLDLAAIEHFLMEREAWQCKCEQELQVMAGLMVLVPQIFTDEREVTYEGCRFLVSLGGFYSKVSTLSHLEMQIDLPEDFDPVIKRLGPWQGTPFSVPNVIYVKHGLPENGGVLDGAGLPFYAIKPTELDKKYIPVQGKVLEDLNRAVVEVNDYLLGEFSDQFPHGDYDIADYAGAILIMINYHPQEFIYRDPNNWLPWALKAAKKDWENSRDRQVGDLLLSR